MSWFSTDTKDKDKRYCYHIHGYKECGYFRRGTICNSFHSLNFSGVQQGQLIKSKNSNVEVQVHAVPHEEWPKELEQLRQKYKSKSADMGTHKTSPAIWEGCGNEYTTFVGGYTDFLKRSNELHQQQKSNL